jgi:hypothetical protein
MVAATSHEVVVAELPVVEAPGMILLGRTRKV